MTGGPSLPGPQLPLAYGTGLRTLTPGLVKGEEGLSEHLPISAEAPLHLRVLCTHSSRDGSSPPPGLCVRWALSLRNRSAWLQAPGVDLALRRPTPTVTAPGAAVYSLLL